MIQCYGAVSFFSPNALPGELEADVKGLLLEYIPDGKPLEDMDSCPSTDPSRILDNNYTPFARPLMALVHEIPKYHGDVRSGNLILTPTRLILIDFGHAQFIRGGMSEDEWRQEGDEVEALRLILNRRGLRDRTPRLSSSEWDERFGYYYFNYECKWQSKAWRTRFLNQLLPYEEVDEEKKEGSAIKGATERKDTPAIWEFKEDVRTG